MMIVASILIVFLMDQLFKLRQTCLVEKHRFRLYALRDELRELAMRGEASPGNWVFQYLDSSISKSIDVLPSISVWRVIPIVYQNRHDRRTSLRFDQLLRELKKRQNSPLARVYGRYLLEIGRFVSHRHDTILVVVNTVSRLLNATGWVHRGIKIIKNTLTSAPQTSTLPEFARC